MGGQLSSSVQDTYHMQKVKLGEGSFGVVWRGVHKKSGLTVAIKQLDKKKFALRNVSKADVEREIGILKVLHHDNIIQLHETFEDADFMYLTLDYCDGGDFGDKVLERGVDMTEPEVVYWSAQMLAAIDFMHGQRICHRDIKPDNFLVSGDRLKLADLGLATTCPHGMLRDKCGTPAFMSPEQHALPSGPGYSTPVDIWAAGLCVYMLTTGGHHPFLSSKNHLDNESLRQGKLDWKVGQSIFATLGLTGARISDDLRGLCHEMVCVDMRRRTTANQCLRRLGYPGMHGGGTGSPGGPTGGYPNRSSVGGGQMATAATAGIGKMIGGAASAARGAASAAGAALDKLPRPSFTKKRKQWIPQLGYIWMLQTPQGFVELPPQYHDVLEKEYRAFTAGQAQQVHMGINGSTYVVDFREMLCYTAGPSESRSRVKAIQRVQRKG